MPLNEFHWDRLATMHPAMPGMGAMKALSTLQHYPPEMQVAGVTLLFMLLMKRYKLHPGNVLEVANNMFERALEHSEGMRAALLYVKHEL